MLTGLILADIALKNITIITINITSFIFKTSFVILEGMCMHFTNCNENGTLLSI